MHELAVLAPGQLAQVHSPGAQVHPPSQHLPVNSVPGCLSHIGPTHLASPSFFCFELGHPAQVHSPGGHEQLSPHAQAPVPTFFSLSAGQLPHAHLPGSHVQLPVLVHLSISEPKLMPIESAVCRVLPATWTASRAGAGKLGGKYVPASLVVGRLSGLVVAARAGCWGGAVA